MFLQGDLQAVFDALYGLGVIDPVLEMDWSDEMKELEFHYPELEQAVAIANRYQNSPDDLINHLGQFTDKVLNFLAMEVAREFADFHSRDQIH
jgi:hypothetical protein